MSNTRWDTFVWAGGDVVWTMSSLALAPRLLTGNTLEEKPVLHMQVALMLVLTGRIAWFYTQCPRHAKYARADKSTISFLLHTFLTCIAGAFILHVVLVLFGAPFFQMSERTFLFASLFSSLVTMPFAWISSRSGRVEAILDEFLQFYVFFSTDTMVDNILFHQIVGTVAGAWLGAIPIPLDWDRPWQAWPITLVYGAGVGYLSGSLLGLFLLFGNTDTSHASKKRI